MSKREMLSVDRRSKGTADPSTGSYQSAWMAHWKVAKPSPPNGSEVLLLNRGAREVASNSTGGQEASSSQSDVLKTDNRFCEVPAKNTVNVVDEATNTADTVDEKTAAMASQCFAEEGSLPSLALAPPWPDNDSIPLGNQRASSLSYHRFPKDQIEGPGHVSKQALESENIRGKKNIVYSTHYQESPLGSSSRQFPHILDDARGNSLSLALSAAKLDHHASSATPSLWNRAASLLQHDYTPTGQKRHFTHPAENSPLEATKCKAFRYEHSFRPSHSVVDVMTTRTQTFVDSTERVTAGQMKFTQTMHQLFFSENMDTRKSKRSRIMQESTIYANYQGNDTNGQFLSLSTDGNHHGNPGVKLQPLWSSTDSEGHENLADIKTSTAALKDESSAETNTLDMVATAGKHLLGEASSSPNKNAVTTEGSRSLAKVKSGERKRKFLTLTISSSSNDGEPSPSKTQSLEEEHLLPNDDRGSHSNPEAHAHCSSRREPEQRDGWLKHSKASDSDQLREGLKLGEASPAQKVNDLFGVISKQMKGMLPPVTTTNTPGKQATGPGERAPSGDKRAGGKGRGALLSNPWIQRWCHRKAAAAQRKKQVPHDQSNPKTLDELQRKHSPSVAAMALMGKAMNGFHPCEFTRRGSLTLWNT